AARLELLGSARATCQVNIQQDLLYCSAQGLGRRGLGISAGQRRPNKSFKPNPLRYAKHMAGKACHVFRFTTLLGLTLVLGAHMILSLGLVLIALSGPVTGADIAERVQPDLDTFVFCVLDKSVEQLPSGNESAVIARLAAEKCLTELKSL